MLNYAELIFCFFLVQNRSVPISSVFV